MLTNYKLYDTIILRKKSQEWIFIKKEFSLDYTNIVTLKERNEKVTEILKELDEDPNTRDLELLANYILYGKTEEGESLIQQGYLSMPRKKYTSYKKLRDKTVVSLDALLASPFFNHMMLSEVGENRSSSPKRVRHVIVKPTYDQEGNEIDPGDGNIPGMREIWSLIDELQEILDMRMGKIKQTEEMLLNPKSNYDLYRIKHNLINLKTHQYYLKDSAQGGLIHPQKLIPSEKTEVYWGADTGYWISKDIYEARIRTKYKNWHKQKRVPEQRTLTNGQIEYYWIVSYNHIDYENIGHIRNLIKNYDKLYKLAWENPWGWMKAILWDLEFYTDLVNFSELRLWIIDKVVQGVKYEKILQDMKEEFGIEYEINHLAAIISREIPKKISNAAKKHRIETECYKTKKLRGCYGCEKILPNDPLFFAHNSSTDDGVSNFCKDCEKKKRIKRGQSENDLRTKRGKKKDMP